MSTDASGRYLFSASYGGNLLAVNRIGENGIAGDVQQTVKTGPMAHAIRQSPDGRYAFASVLGADAWLRLPFDASTGTLTGEATPAYRLPDQSGPRHFVFSSNGRFAYLIDELDGKLHVLALSRGGADARPIQTVSILPPDFHGDKPWGADLHLTPDGRFLYASERTSSTLAAYRVDAKSGRLVRIGTFATEQQPRGFAIDPSGRYLLAAGQLSPTLAVYRIERNTGHLDAIGKYPVGKGRTGSRSSRTTGRTDSRPSSGRSVLSRGRLVAAVDRPLVAPVRQLAPQRRTCVIDERAVDEAAVRPRGMHDADHQHASEHRGRPEFLAPQTATCRRSQRQHCADHEEQVDADRNAVAIRAADQPRGVHEASTPPIRNACVQRTSGCSGPSRP